MEIRKSTTDDVPAILEIFRAAKAYMAAHGNPTQWGGDYPGLPELLPDIARGDSYVLTENGTVVGTFSFIIGAVLITLGVIFANKQTEISA